MDKQDVKNNEIIKRLITSYMGYDDESLAYFHKELDTPFIDEEYAKILGPDRRKRWEISSEMMKMEDVAKEVYKIFTQYFHTFTCKSCSENNKVKIITKEEIMKNTAIVGKNEVKIKKILSENYMKNKAVWEYDIRQTGADIPHDQKQIDDYIIKAFEKIGTVKTPNSKKKVELVLSFNFADFMMCSIKESWTSCYDLEKGYYWFAVPGLIGDKDRALMYLTDGRKKEFMGIEVDSMMTRSWIMLTDDNRKGIVKFYPNDNYNSSSIKKMTGDDSYFDLMDNACNGKNNIKFPFFKSGMFFTTSNDACALGSIDKDLNARWRYGRGGGVQAIDKYLKRMVPFNNYGHDFFKDLERNGKQYNDLILISRCSECGSAEVRHHHEGKKFCSACFTKKFSICFKCGIVHLRENTTEINGRKYCPLCVPKPFTCPKCGQEKYNPVLIEGTNICKECADAMPKCRACGGQHYKMTVVHHVESHKRLHRCVRCATIQFPTYVRCPSCDEFWPVEKLKYEGGICKNCRDKK